jgi:hypothetical protein
MAVEHVCFAEFGARQVASSEDEADRLIKTGAPMAVFDGLRGAA